MASLHNMLINVSVDGTGATRELKQINNEIKAQQVQLKAYDKIVGDTELTLGQLTKRLQLTNNVYTLQGQKLDELKRKREELVNAGDKESKKYLSIVNQINKLTSEYVANGKAIDSLKYKVDSYRSGINATDKSINRLSDTTRRNSETLRASGNVLGALRAEHQGLTRQLLASSQGMTSQRDLIDRLTTQYGEHSDVVRTANSDYDRMVDRHNRLSSSLRDVSNNIRNTSGNISNLVNTGVHGMEHLGSKVMSLGTIFKVSLVGSIASAVTSISPLMSSMVASLSGALGSIGSSVLGVGTAGIIGMGAFKSLNSKREQLSQINSQIDAMRGQSSNVVGVGSGASGTTATKKTNNNDAMRKVYQNQINAIDKQINGIETRNRKEEEAEQRAERLSELASQRAEAERDLVEINKDLNSIKKDSELSEIRADKRANEKALKAVSDKIKNRKELLSYEYTERLLKRQAELKKNGKELDKKESKEESSVEQKRQNLLKQRADKLQSIAKINADIKKAQKGDNNTSQLDALKAKRDALQASMSGLSSMGSTDVGGITSGALASQDALNDLIKQRDSLLSDMTPAELRMSKALDAYKDFYGKYTKSYQSQWFDIAIRGLGTLETLLNKIRPFIQESLDGIEIVGKRIDAWVNSKRFTKLIDGLTKSVKKNIVDLSTGIGIWGEGLLNLIVTLQPLADFFNKGLINIGKTFNRWVQSDSLKESITNLIEYLRRNMPEIKEGLRQFWRFILNISHIANQIGETVLPMLNNGMKWLNDKMESFSAFWDGLSDGTKKFLIKINWITTGIIALGGVIATALAPFFALNKVLKAWTGKGFGNIFNGLGQGGSKALKAIPYVGTAVTVGAGAYGVANGKTGKDKFRAGATTGGALAGGVIGGAIGTAIAPGVGTVAGAGIGAVVGGTATNKIADSTYDGYAKASKKIKEFYNTLRQDSKSFYKSIGIDSTNHKTLITTIYNTALKKAQSYTSDITGKIKKQWHTATDGINILSSISNGWDKIRVSVGSLGGSVSNTMSRLVGYVSNTFSQITGYISSVISNILNAFNSIPQAWSKIINSILSFDIKAFLDKGRNIGVSIVNGIKSAVSGFSISSLIGRATSYMGFEDGTDSPLQSSTLALVNDQKGSTYKEIITYPNGQSIIPSERNTLLPLPKGSTVLKASLTAKYLKGLGIPRYEQGLGNRKAETMLNKVGKYKGKSDYNNEMNNDYTDMLTMVINKMDTMAVALNMLLAKDTDLYLDSDKVGTVLDKRTNTNNYRRTQTQGINNYRR